MIVDLTIDPFRILSLYIPTTGQYKGIPFKYAQTAYIAAQCENERNIEQFVNLDVTSAVRLLRKLGINKNFKEIQFEVLYEIFENRFN